MIDIDIPGYGHLALHHVVSDYNGTLAHDGEIIEGVLPRLDALTATVRVHIVTADTFGRVHDALAGHDYHIHILPPGGQDEAKAGYVEALGAGHVAALGNGRNDRDMVDRAALGLAVIEREGAAAATLMAADVVCPGVLVALDLLTHPLRLVATLRR